MSSDIEQAIRQICEEKGLSYEAVMETVESAMAAAYRKDYGNKMQNIQIEFDPLNGDIRAFDVKTVVEDLPEEEIEAMRQAEAQKDALKKSETAVQEKKIKEPKNNDEKKEIEVSDDKDNESESEEEKDLKNDEAEENIDEEDDGPKFNPKTDVMYSDARVLKFDAEIGDEIKTELPVAGEFGRMAAMTAKQVITQKLREAEREIIFGEFKEQEGEVLIGTVQRKEGRLVLVDLGRTVGVIPMEEQIRSERYNPGDRIKVFVKEVGLGTRGPQIVLSRSSEELVRSLFDIEIPEVADGTIEIKAIAREAGARSKVAVMSNDDSVDPIGACIGQRGVRIQTIINELGGEKIDVIEWNDDSKSFITSALAPAKVLSIELNEEEKEAEALVTDDQLSLAIGRGGQNVRLAAKLSGWKLSVKGDGSAEELPGDELDESNDDEDDDDSDITEEEE